MSFVLDCSMTMAWCFRDEATDLTDRVREDLAEDTAIVPEVLWDLEVQNSLLSAERRGRLTDDALGRNLELLAALPIERVIPPIAMTLALATRTRITSYDAAYLALARQLALPLATLDRGLSRAANASGVELYDARG